MPAYDEALFEFLVLRGAAGAHVLPLAPAWQRDAVCAGEDIEKFFPEGKGSSTAVGKELCSWCPVRRECLQWALDHDERGVWGGTSYRQRERMRKHGAEAA